MRIALQVHAVMRSDAERAVACLFGGGGEFENRDDTHEQAAQVERTVSHRNAMIMTLIRVHTIDIGNKAEERAREELPPSTDKTSCSLVA